MPNSSLAVLILAAGQSKRMRSSLSKTLHPLASRPLVQYILDLAKAFDPIHTCLVLSPQGYQEPFYQSLEGEPDLSIAIQPVPLGTGDAVSKGYASILQHHPSFDGDVLVLFGDTPFLLKGTVEKLIARKRAQDNNTAVALLGMCPPDPLGYGLLQRDQEGYVHDITETAHLEKIPKDALWNSGVILLGAQHVSTLLSQLTLQKNGEYYLTEVVKIAKKNQLSSIYVKADWEELSGVNTRAELARAESIFQERMRHKMMAEGVTLMDPATTYFSFDTTLAQDVTVYPNVFFGRGVTVETGARILPFSHIEHTHIGPNSVVGPFCRLRGETKLGASCQIGNFTEVKASTLEDHVNAKHLTYLGDAQIGEHANIGAGTITCNYDGKQKHPTTIGSRSFIGSNSALIAPLNIGENAMIGAGSVITKDVTSDTLALTRSEQKHIPRKKKI